MFWHCTSQTFLSSCLTRNSVADIPCNAGVSADCTVMDFQKMVAAACSVEPAQQHFKAGFPPKPMPITDTQLPVAQWGLKNGDSLVLEGKPAASTSATPAAAVSTPAPSSAQASGSRAETSVTNAPTSSAVGQSLPDGRCALHSMSATDSSSTSVLTNRVPWGHQVG